MPCKNCFHNPQIASAKLPRVEGFSCSINIVQSEVWRIERLNVIWLKEAGGLLRIGPISVDSRTRAPIAKRRVSENRLEEAFVRDTYVVECP